MLLWNEGRLTAEQIEKAVNWWADRVCAPSFSGLTEEERSDPRNAHNLCAEAMAYMAVEPVSEEQRRTFVKALQDKLAQADWHTMRAGLRVDYYPGPILAEAAQIAGIPTDNFPWKSRTRFREDGSVWAACGYGNPAQKL